MTGYRVFKVVKMLVLVVLALLVFGIVTEHLWNWLMPAIFGLKAITFLQALGLVVLTAGEGGAGGSAGWKSGGRG